MQDTTQGLPTPDAEVIEKKSWFQKKAQSKFAWWWFGLFSFLESSPVLLPPTDLFLAIMVFFNRARVFSLALFSTVTSVLGGLVSYIVAALLFSVSGPIIEWLNIASEIEEASVLLGNYAFITLFLAALTPIPFTPVVFAAGFLHVHIATFLVASLLGRGIRYFLVAWLTYVFGVSVIPRLEKVATRTTLSILGVVFILAVLAFFFFH